MTLASENNTAIKSKAIVWTVALHLLLLLLFFWLQYTVPVVMQDTGMGMEVNLGSSDNGSGNDQPMAPGDPANFSAAVALPQQEKVDDLPKDYLKTDEPDANAINNPTNVKKQPADNTAKNNPPEPKPIPKYVYNGNAAGKGGNGAQQTAPGTNEGNGTGPGDKGVAGGTPGAANYDGASGSGGIGHTLSGRQITPDKFVAEFKEGGKVVVHVTVDKDGNIVNRYVKSSSNQQLTKLALDKLSRAKFSRSNSTEPQQFGDVTIVFKARN